VNNSTQGLIEAVNNATSAITLLKAVQALAAQQDPEAITTLIAVLGYNNPGAAVAAVEGLIALGQVVIAPLLEQVDDYNYGARAWAVRVFAGIGDPKALDLLMTSALEDFSPSVRRAATKGIKCLVSDSYRSRVGSSLCWGSRIRIIR
jgi:phycocyanobilin lyase beta subunit